MNGRGRSGLGVALAFALLGSLVAFVAWHLAGQTQEPDRATGELIALEPRAARGSSEEGRDGRSAGPPSTGARALDPGGLAGPDLEARRQRASAIGGDEHSWQGLVVDAEDEAPVPGASVTLFTGAVERVAESDETGHFALAWSAPSQPTAAIGSAGPIVVVTHPDYLTRRCAFDPSVERLVLVRAAVLAGTLRGPGLVESDGQARVVLWSEARRADGGRTVLETSCDESGAFRFGGLEVGSYAVAAAGASSVVAVRAGLVPERRGAGIVTLDLQSGARASGRVFERARDSGVEGCELRAVWRGAGVPREVAELFERRATSQAAGRYELRGLTPGTVRVEVTTPWGAEQTTALDVRASGERLEVDFPVGYQASLAGRVVDPGGQGVGRARLAVFVDEPAVPPAVPPIGDASPAPPSSSDAELAADSADIDLTGARLVETDLAGAYTLTDLPLRERIVLVGLPPLGDARWRSSRPRSVRLAPDEERAGFDLALEVSAQLVGTVTDLEGAPVAGAEVRLEVPAAGPDLSGRSISSDARGDFDVQCSAGPVKVTVTAEGYASLSRGLKLASGVPTVQRFELEPAAHVRFEVVDESGFAIEGARVRLLQRDEKQKRKRTLTGRTDVFGRAELENVPLGLWETAVWADGFVALSLAPESALVPDTDLVVAELERVAPNPASAHGLALAKREDPVPAELAFDGIGPATVTHDAGRFEITGLRPGSARIVVSAERCVPAVLSVVLEPGRDRDLGVVELEPLTRVEVRLATTGGSSVRRARVHLEPTGPKSQRKTQVVKLAERKPGRYLANEVAFGRWKLVVERKGKKRFEKLLEIEPRELQTIKLQLPK